jgi:hypothetical protein
MLYNMLKPCFLNFLETERGGVACFGEPGNMIWLFLQFLRKKEHLAPDSILLRR